MSGAPARIPSARFGVREALAVREFRAVLLSSALSVLGDQVARIAVALLVFDRTHSGLAASATYACSYLTWLVSGPFLSALADRHRRRRLMVGCDLARAALIAVLVVPGLPLWALFAVLVVVGLLSPPFDSARGALLPEVLGRDLYPVGNTVLTTAAQAGQVFGFLLGGALVAVTTARGALAVDAATFLVSALLLVAGVRERPAPTRETVPLVHDVREGVSLVAADPALRRLLGYGVLGALAVIAPEGLAVPVADRVGGGAVTAGVLTAAVPAGFLLGSFLVLRLPLARRLALMPGLSALACVPLLFTPLAAHGSTVAVLWAVAGVGNAVQLVANSEYMSAAPEHARGRAYGVAVTVLMAVQGLTLLFAGGLAELVDPRAAVAVVGLLALLVLPVLVYSAARAQDAWQDGRQVTG